MVPVPSLENLSSPVFGKLVKNRECHSPVLLVSGTTCERDYWFCFAV